MFWKNTGYDFEKLFPLVDYFQILSYAAGAHEFFYASQPAPLAPIVRNCIIINLLHIL